jgi:hypothetical protein
MSVPNLGRFVMVSPEARPFVASSSVEAIIVPTNRPYGRLRTIVSVAQRLGCVLVVLCSGDASIDATERLVKDKGVELLAIDTSRLPEGLMPYFRTTDMLKESVFDLNTDLSLKRNLGMLLARLVNWTDVVFLDDDIDVPDPEDLNRAISLLEQHGVVGLLMDGFPDNSVVRHAYREVGGIWPGFVGGGGALAMNPSVMTTFFPKVYNEDLLFLLDHPGLRPAAISGNAVQSPYDPFKDAARARAQELGDTIAEAVLLLYREGRQLSDANLDYWRGFLRSRQQMINDTLTKTLAYGNLAQRNAMLAALAGAHAQSVLIDSKTCMEYLIALRDDRSRWHEHIGMVQRKYMRMVSGVASVPAALGLKDCARYVAP